MKLKIAEIKFQPNQNSSKNLTKDPTISYAKLAN